MNSRSFKIISITRSGKRLNLSGGRYISKTPMEAARKMFSHAVRLLKNCGKCSLVITLMETTAGSDNKTYVYKISKINSPVTIEKNGQKILYKFKTQVKSI